MTLTLLADAVLRPYLAQLIPYSPHAIQTIYLSDSLHKRQTQIARQLSLPHHCDALVLLDGTDLIPEEGWQIGDVPLALANVHNLAALLLGSQDAHSRLFSRYDGGICWITPGQRQEWYTTPKEDCHQLCLLCDEQFSLPDTSVYAQMIARYNGWDFIQTSSDLSLLESLVCGGWNSNDFIISSPGQILLPPEYVSCY